MAEEGVDPGMRCVLHVVLKRNVKATLWLWEKDLKRNVGSFLTSDTTPHLNFTAAKYSWISKKNLRFQYYSHTVKQVQSLPSIKAP